jgi:hypothetical protein
MPAATQQTQPAQRQQPKARRFRNRRRRHVRPAIADAEFVN